MCSRSDEYCITYCWILKYAIQHVEHNGAIFLSTKGNLLKTSTNRSRMWCQVARWKDPTWRLYVSMKLAPKGAVVAQKKLNENSFCRNNVSTSFTFKCWTVYHWLKFLAISVWYVSFNYLWVQWGSLFFRHLNVTRNPPREYTTLVKCLSRSA